MSIFDSLFSSKTIIDTASKGIYNGLDMAVFTDEEKAKAQQKLLDWKLEYYKATKPQALSRRYLAMIIGFSWLVLVWLYVGLGVLGYDEQALFVYNVLNDIVNQPFSIVSAFYFLAHVVGNGK